MSMTPAATRSIDGNNKYWYDAEGQHAPLQSLAVPVPPFTQYIYDAEGARIAKTTIPAAPPTATSSLCAPPLSAGYTLTCEVSCGPGRRSSHGVEQ